MIEIGAGMGAAGARLSRRYKYIGVEPDARSALVAQARVAAGGTVIVGDSSALPPDAISDFLCAFEVLEHIQDDAGALRGWREHVRPGGSLIVSVPAWRHRFGASDIKVGHFRRYDRVDLERVLLDGGFIDPQIFSYGFPLGYLLQPVWSLLSHADSGPATAAQRSAESGRWLQPTDRLAWLPWLVSLPFRLLQRPFVHTKLGTGFVAVARRPL